MTKKALGLLIGLTALVLFLASCGGSIGDGNGSGSGDGGQTNGVIHSFTASPSSHKVGDAVTFEWDISNPNSSSCSIDADGDGTAEDYHLICPETGTFTYTYPHAGDYTAKFYLGPISNAEDSENAFVYDLARDLSTFYSKLYVIKDCDAGAAGAGEFGWDLLINNAIVSTADQNNAVAISDGQYVDLSSIAHKHITITNTTDTLSFTGTIYEYDNGSKITQPFSFNFDQSKNWGILDVGRVWVKRFDISSSCSFEISVAVREF